MSLDSFTLLGGLGDLWHNALAGGAAVGLILGVWISARTLGLLTRPRYWLRSTYMPPQDLIGLFAMPHFMLEYENRGNVPVVFSDFVLFLPRLQDVIDKEGTFILHPGAELFIDKRSTTRLRGSQLVKKADYRTNKVRLEPGESHTDFFDLGALVNMPGDGEMIKRAPTVPADFSPVLEFHDNFGRAFFCDAEGIHAGRYVYPHLEALEAAGKPVSLDRGVLAWRRWFRWAGWKTEVGARGLGE